MNYQMALLPLKVQQQQGLFQSVLAVIFILMKEQELDAKCIPWLDQRMQICVLLLMKNVLTCWSSRISFSIAGL
jgi:hypothetical protein